jgi:hypothetical protein
MIKVPINIPTYKRSKRNKKSNPNSWYIYKTKLMLAALFFKTAGGVGRIILDYLLWKRSMNGVEQTTLPNEFFFIRYGIPRQRKADALLKLKAAGLVVVHKEPGKAALVKLNIEEDYGKENK